jgi:hypothetical protein
MRPARPRQPGPPPWVRLGRMAASYGVTSSVSGHIRGYHRAAAVTRHRIPGGGRAGQPQHRPADRARERRLELLALLALGTEFQVRLAGTVAAAWAEGGARAADRAAASRSRPALVAALAGRLAPAARDWLGVDQDLVEVTLHEDAGWGRLAASGDRGLRAALPARWLASVWAAGLAVVAGHLVVAVERAAWPRATVLAVREPGAGPVILEVRATDGGWVADAG